MRSVGDEVRGQVIATVYDDGTFSVRLFTPDGTDSGLTTEDVEQTKEKMVDDLEVLVPDTPSGSQTQ